MGKKRTLRQAKNARKIDTSALEDHIVVKREEVLLGGDISTRPDSEIFSIDKPSEDEVVKSRKKLNQEKMLSYEKALLPNPHVPTASDVVRNLSMRSADDVLVSRLARSVQKRKQPEKSQSNGSSGVYDVWATNNPDDTPNPDDFAEDAKKFKRRKAPKPSVKNSALPSVVLPEPGNSYNPDFEQHQDVIADAVAKETRRSEKEKIWDRKLYPQSGRKQRILSQEEQNENVDALVDVKSEDEGEDAEPVAVELPEPKTKQQRQKEKRKKVRDDKQKQKQNLKKFRQDAEKLDSIVLDLDKTEEFQKRKYEEKKFYEENVKPENLRFGHIKPHEPDVVNSVLLTEELPGRLRKMPAIKTNLFEESLNHIDRRGILPGAKKREKQEAWKKSVDKHNQHVWFPNQDKK